MVIVMQISNFQIPLETEILFSLQQILRERNLGSFRPNKARLPPVAPGVGSQTRWYSFIFGRVLVVFKSAQKTYNYLWPSSGASGWTSSTFEIPSECLNNFGYLRCTLSCASLSQSEWSNFQVCYYCISLLSYVFICIQMNYGNNRLVIA